MRANAARASGRTRSSRAGASCARSVAAHTKRPAWSKPYWSSSSLTDTKWNELSRYDARQDHAELPQELLSLGSCHAARMLSNPRSELPVPSPASPPRPGCRSAASRCTAAGTAARPTTRPSASSRRRRPDTGPGHAQLALAGGCSPSLSQPSHRIAESFDVSDFDLTDAEPAAVDPLDIGTRGGPRARRDHPWRPSAAKSPNPKGRFARLLTWVRKGSPVDRHLSAVLLVRRRPAAPAAARRPARVHMHRRT